MSKRRKFLLRQCALFIVNCAFWGCVLWCIGHFVGYVTYIDAPDKDHSSESVGLAFVNRLQRDEPEKTGCILFERNGQHFGIVEGVPVVSSFINSKATNCRFAAVTSARPPTVSRWPSPWAIHGHGFTTPKSLPSSIPSANC